jgi:hypothetical protein
VLTDGPGDDVQSFCGTGALGGPGVGARLPSWLRRVLGRMAVVPPSREGRAATNDHLLGLEGLTARARYSTGGPQSGPGSPSCRPGASVAQREAFADRLPADPACGDVNPTWPHRDGVGWPQLSRIRGCGLLGQPQKMQVGRGRAR